MRGKSVESEISRNRQQHWLTLSVVSGVLGYPVMGSSWHDKRNLQLRICTNGVKAQATLTWLSTGSKERHGLGTLRQRIVGYNPALVT